MKEEKKIRCKKGIECEHLKPFCNSCFGANGITREGKLARGLKNALKEKREQLDIFDDKNRTHIQHLIYTH